MNPLTQYPVPQWIVTAFLMAIPLPFLLIVLFVKNAAGKLKNSNAFTMVSVFFVLYLGYIAYASYAGWFNVVSLPPRVLLLTTFPYAFLLFVVVAKTSTFQNILQNASLQSLVQLHIFRVIGIFFLLLAYQDALPKPFALIAGIGDIITAISSVFVARAISGNKPYAKQLTFWWNIFGTVDILFTAIAANVITKLSIDSGVMGVDTLAVFPFCIIPAFAPPTILFLHWTIFKKMK